ncbi:MAG: TonB-dependent receptor [Sphingobacteriales bacterium SCN 48-20]|uniref:outer membrane beta-barrel family protein n=1 Tax=Terrimonas ferruginea TaxID=249 RepID=UPI00086DD470|nr:outer membrane beta-barrel family protein [Terrimonas ferruginea]ODT94610.1 MAG: TonB-dependent receptor [Sphingobacteriales bacterium SCN 48-20]OJW40485.1 MAG: TonB-dependent receptor [Sphingobacteriales bacterium 48-107]
MRKVWMLSLIVLLTVAANAQQISGTVKDQSGKGVDKTTVSLLRAKDSSVAKLSVTDNEGRYSFTQTEAGSYLVSVSHVGFMPYISQPFAFDGTKDVAVPAVGLVKNEGTLSGVTVVSKKPVVEVKADKTILNVEGTINAVGNDALELLRKAPGVMVDKDDNLTMAGKNGVQVFIDGKPSPLQGADLANFLKSLQSSQVESIELITNPSAKYEAAGNAGIINIRLKKNKTFGTNGSVNAGYNIGTFAKYNAGLALNHRNSKVNIFGNYNFNHGLNTSSMKMYREQADSIFNQTNRVKALNEGHNFKAGLDYFLNAKSTIGAIVNGNIGSTDFRSSGPTFISYLPTKELDRLMRAESHNDMKRTNLNFNLNYRYAMTGGSELNVDADYGIFNLRSNQFQPNYYFDETGTTELYRNVYRMIAPTNIDLYSVKVDYEKNFLKGRLGLGGKVGFVNTDNDFRRYDVFGNTEVLNNDLSNRFEYKENINAVYANYNRGFKGFMVQLGLRVENTDSKGYSTGKQWNANEGVYKDYDSTIHRNYTDLFPSAAITFNKNPMSQFGFTYSRRIDRPAYQDLNPFEFRLNDYAYMKGNTQLRPQYTNSVGFTHTYKYRLTTALNYSHVKDIFTQLPDTIDNSKAFMTKKNLASQDIVSLNVSYPFQYKWYTFFANVNAYYSMYKADFGGGDRKVNQDVFAMTYYMQNSFNLGKSWTAEVSGFYSSPSIWQGVFRSKAMYGIDGGLQKGLFKGKGNLKLSVSDIFRTMRWAGESRFTGTYGNASGRWESRQFKINFSYRFGNMQVKAARQRKTGIDDESKRASGGGSTTPGQ